jgi:hypothetical protein
VAASATSLGLRLPDQAAQVQKYVRFVADRRVGLEHIPDIRKAA